MNPQSETKRYKDYCFKGFLCKGLETEKNDLFYRPSRNRTYIINLEGSCLNPLDDRPYIIKIYGWVIQDLNL